MKPGRACSQPPNSVVHSRACKFHPAVIPRVAAAAARRRKMRTTNGIERAIQQELKRRTRKIRVFLDVDSLMRVAAGLLVEVDEEWLTVKAYVKWEREDD